MLALDCLPRLYGNSLMLKTPYTLATGHGEIKLVSAKRLPPCSLALTVLEGVAQASGAEELVTIMARHAHGYNRGTDVLGAGGHLLALPEGRPTPYEEAHSFQGKSCQEPMDEELTSPRSEPILLFDNWTS